VSKGALSRRKGAAWQAELAKRWRDLGLWIAARSTQGEQRAYGALGADVEGTPFYVEAKHRRAVQPLQALLQAEDEAFERNDARPCIAVVRPHGTGPDGAVVVMRLGTFEAIADSWRGPIRGDLAPPLASRATASATLRAMSQHPGQVEVPGETWLTDGQTWTREAAE
jgi:hypothetical protein